MVLTTWRLHADRIFDCQKKNQYNDIKSSNITESMSEKGPFLKVDAVHSAFRAIAGHYKSTPSLIFPSLGVTDFNFSEHTGFFKTRRRPTDSPAVVSKGGSYLLLTFNLWSNHSFL